MVIMKETSVESLFGIKAGIVWQTLNQNGASNIRNLVKATSLSREEVYSGLGWLGREDKIILEQKGRAMIFSLREEEAHIAVSEEITAEPASKAKSKPRKTKQPKTKKARKVKSPIKQAEKIEEFLLH
jgi:hypothetical protein